MAKTLREVVEWRVYEPLDWEAKMGYRRDPKWCAHQVHTGIVGFRQCGKQPAETIEGYGFCRQHAKMVRERLEREKSDE